MNICGVFNSFNDILINPCNIGFRLFLAFIVGSLIGLEREHHRQPAGLRTHILICVGATLLTLVSIYIPQTLRYLKNGDPGRIAAQVVSGIGFLGAGAIIRLGVNVKGITTAASIWAVAALGIAIGAGMYYGAILCALIILFSLIALDVVEKKIFPSKYLRTLQIYCNTDDVNIDDLSKIVEKHGVDIKSTDVSQSFDDKTLTLTLLVQIPEAMKYRKLYEEIGTVNGVSKASIKHDF